MLGPPRPPLSSPKLFLVGFSFLLLPPRAFARRLTSIYIYLQGYFGLSLRMLGHYQAPLVPPWRPWAPLGPPWVPLAPPLVFLGFPWLPLGPPWLPLASLGPPLAPLGPPWVPAEHRFRCTGAVFRRCRLKWLLRFALLGALAALNWLAL